VRLQVTRQILKIHTSTARLLGSRRNSPPDVEPDGSSCHLALLRCSRGAESLVRFIKHCGFHEVDGDESRYIGDGVSAPQTNGPGFTLGVLDLAGNSVA